MALIFATASTLPVCLPLRVRAVGVAQLHSAPLGRCERVLGALTDKALVVGKRIRMQRKIATSPPTPKIKTRTS